MNKTPVLKTGVYFFTAIIFFFKWKKRNIQRIAENKLPIGAAKPIGTSVSGKYTDAK